MYNKRKTYFFKRKLEALETSQTLITKAAKTTLEIQTRPSTACYYSALSEETHSIAETPNKPCSVEIAGYMLDKLEMIQLSSAVHRHIKDGRYRSTAGD
jgi:hypothetical protein